MDLNEEVEDRWTRGKPHHSISEDFRAFIGECENDPLDLKFGGDGDMGETLLYMLDCYIEHRRIKGMLKSSKEEANVQSSARGHRFRP